MRPPIIELWRDEDGAVTVDWIVLTAFMAGFGFLVVTIIAAAALDPVDGVGARLDSDIPKF